MRSLTQPHNPILDASRPVLLIQINRNLLHSRLCQKTPRMAYKDNAESLKNIPPLSAPPYGIQQRIQSFIEDPTWMLRTASHW